MPPVLAAIGTIATALGGVAATGATALGASATIAGAVGAVATGATALSITGAAGGLISKATGGSFWKGAAAGALGGLAGSATIGVTNVMGITATKLKPASSLLKLSDDTKALTKITSELDSNEINRRASIASAKSDAAAYLNLPSSPSSILPLIKTKLGG